MAEKVMALAAPVIGVYNMVWDYLTLEGGESNLIGDYEAEVVYASFVPKVGLQRFHISSVIIHVEQVTPFEIGKYDGSALTNGIQLQVRGPIGIHDDAAIGVPGGHANYVKSWGDWSQIGGHINVYNWIGAKKGLQAEIALESGILALDTTAGEYLAVQLNDDFTDLLSHTFIVQGFYAP